MPLIQDILKPSQSQLEQTQVTAVSTMDQSDLLALCPQDAEMHDPEIRQASGHQYP